MDSGFDGLSPVVDGSIEGETPPLVYGWMDGWMDGWYLAPTPLYSSEVQTSLTNDCGNDHSDVYSYLVVRN